MLLYLNFIWHHHSQLIHQLILVLRMDYQLKFLQFLLLLVQNLFIHILMNFNPLLVHLLHLIKLHLILEEALIFMLYYKVIHNFILLLIIINLKHFMIVKFWTIVIIFWDLIIIFEIIESSIWFPLIQEENFYLITLH